jgi:hypothetical protein
MGQNFKIVSDLTDEGAMADASIIYRDASATQKSHTGRTTGWP